MARHDPAGIEDGAPLRVLALGLVIVRYRKHDAIDPARYDTDELRRITSKVWGSKFLPNWSLDRVTDWLAEQVVSRGWPAQPGHRLRVDVRLDEPVGISDGQRVHTIRIDSDGRQVHAYPVKDQP